jgi:hypothetical protein
MYKYIYMHKYSYAQIDIYIYIYYQQQYPIRFGIVLASENHENDLKSVEKIDTLYDSNKETSNVDINR